jgi:hypothetical protein
MWPPDFLGLRNNIPKRFVRSLTYRVEADILTNEGAKLTTFVSYKIYVAELPTDDPNVVVGSLRMKPAQSS